jgi:uncharacterized protein
MTITPFYAALLALVFFLLSIRIIKIRRGQKIALGDAGSHALLRAIRAHANFAEYVPLCLLLLYFAESMVAAELLLHALGSCLLLGRLLHAFGVSHTVENFAFRISGMALTFTSLLGSTGYLFYAFVRNAS